MATEGYTEQQTLVAAADYSAAANLGKIVKIDTAAANQAVLVSVLGNRADAILMNKPALGQPCELVTDGIGKALAGAAIVSAGLELTPDATGRLIAAVSTNFVFGISLNATGGAGEWVSVKLCGPYAKP